MSKLSIIIIFLIIVVIIVFAGWLYFDAMGNQNSPVTPLSPSVDASSNKSIASFSITSLNPIVNGVITEANHTVTLTIPYGTDVTNLTPTIEVSDGAAISPASNVAQNFTNAVIYTVTSPDGSHQEYTVIVAIAQKPVQAITSFMVQGQVGDTVINQDNHTIALTVPYGTDVTSLNPVIGLIAGASVDPATNVPQDFSKPVTYTVTTADNAEQSYMVTVTIASQPIVSK